MSAVFTRLKVWTLLLLMFVCAGSYLAAQPHLVFKRITVDNGLPQNTIMSVLQDKTGYIWISTNDGVCKYNGIDFKIYKHSDDDPASLSNNQVNKIFEDSRGNIWIGTFNGLNLYDRGRDCFIHSKVIVKGKKTRYNFESIIEDHQGTIWAGSQKGLFFMQPKGRGQQIVFRKSDITDATVSSMLVDDHEWLWLSAGHKLLIYDLKARRNIDLSALLKGFPSLNTEIKSITQDISHCYWLGTESFGLFRIDLNMHEWKNYTENNGLSSNTVRAVMGDGSSRLWVGTKYGLNIFDLKTGRISKYFNQPDNPLSISQNSIRSIMRDAEGNVWLGTYNGGLNVIYKNSDNFVNLGVAHGDQKGLSGGAINAIVQDTDGSYWIGTDEGGLDHVSEDFERIQAYYPGGTTSDRSIANSVKAIANIGDKLWLGTGNGLLEFDKRSHTFTKSGLVEKPKNPDLIQKFVFLQDGPVLWIGTSFSGLYRVEKGKLIKHYAWNENIKGEFRSGNITALAKNGNRLWVGMQSQGISCLDLQTQKITSFTHRSKHNSLNDNCTVSLLAADRGVWIGTKSGLNYLDYQTERFSLMNDGLNSLTTTIYSMQQDTKNRLWVSTNKGLYSLAFHTKGQNFNPEQVAIANYSVEDGVQSNQFSAGASAVNKKGDLLFGGINGVTRFDPSYIKTNTVAPPVILTDFEVLSRQKHAQFEHPEKRNIEQAQKITLTYDQAYFTIRYAALNYINSQKNAFAYKMEGLADDDWHYVGNQRVATFTNLNPGTYQFFVKASNNDGIWSKAPRILQIKVLPPWWLTPYAYFGYFVIAAGLLYLYNLYARYMERLKAQLQIKAESHRKDQELAQQKINFFLNISHEIKTPLTMVLAPIDKLMKRNHADHNVTQHLTLMQRNGERLLRMINQMLDIQKFDTGSVALEVSNGDVVSFIQEILISFQSLAALKRVKLVFRSAKNELPAWYDRDKLETIIYNLLSNAIKFSDVEGTVTVEANVDGVKHGRALIISVSDNGCGIAPEKLPLLFKRFYHEKSPNSELEGSGLGLAYSKTLVGLHHGTISVQSTPVTDSRAGYTRFEVQLPLEKEAYADDVIIENDLLVTRQTAISVTNTNDLLESRKQDILRREGRERLSMLIAEDNEDLQLFIKESFSDYFDVHAVGDGQQAWEAAVNLSPDIIISDVMMPVMTGVALCGKIKSDIRTSHIPVILLTARNSMQFKKEGLDIGADDYVTKPFEPELLDARVWNLIGSRQQLRARYQKEILLEPRNIVIGNIDEEFLKKAIVTVEKHIDNADFTVDELSEEMAMGRATFGKKIKALTNQTPLEFIRDIRLKRAAQLLAQGQLNVNEVAYMVGFLDVNYFRKCFKEAFNCTPREHSGVLQTEKV